jgi:hypothetical protein
MLGHAVPRYVPSDLGVSNSMRMLESGDICAWTADGQSDDKEEAPCIFSPVLSAYVNNEQGRTSEIYHPALLSQTGYTCNYAVFLLQCHVVLVLTWSAIFPC